MNMNLTATPLIAQVPTGAGAKSTQASLKLVAAIGAGGSAGTFADQLSGLLQDEGSGNDANRMSLLLAMAGLAPDLLQSLTANMPNSQAAANVLQAAGQWMKQHPDAAAQWMGKHPELKDWMKQAELALSAIVPASEGGQAATALPQPISPTVPPPAGQPSDAAKLTDLVEKLSEALGRQPEQTALQTLAAKLVPMFASLVASAAKPAASTADSAMSPVRKDTGVEITATASASGSSAHSTAGWAARSAAWGSKPSSAAVDKLPISLAASAVPSHAGNRMLVALAAKAAPAHLATGTDTQPANATAAGLETPAIVEKPVPLHKAAVADSQPAVQPAADQPANDPGNLTLPGALPLDKPAQPSPIPAAPLPNVNAQQFAQEMAQYVLKTASIEQGDGVSVAKLSLVPEHLGHVDVQLTMQDGQLSAQFVTGTLHGKDLLESQMGQLKQMLQDQGIHVDKLEVSQQSAAQSQLFQEQRRQQQPQEQRSSRHKNTGGYGRMEDDFAIALHEVADSSGAPKYGSTFHATA